MTKHFNVDDLVDFATVNVHDIFAANRLCHVAAHSIARGSQAWSIYTVFIRLTALGAD